MLHETIYFPDKNKKLPKPVAYDTNLSKYVDDFEQRGDFAFILIIENDSIDAI